MKKIFTGFITACMVLSASSVTAFAADSVILNESNNSGTTTVQYTIDSSWKATIPAYINPSEQGNADVEKYSVTLSDVMIGNGATLVGTVEYDGKLVEANDVELGYVLCDADGEIVTNQEIIYADAGNPNAASSYNFGAELTERPRYAGNYLGTATFNFAVNERVFTIGETKPENVIAKFNEDYSQVDIFTAGNDSDGIMRDFNGDSPMQNKAAELETANIEDGVTTIGSQAFNACNKLTSVSISDTVTSIGSDSFKECNSLNTVLGSHGSVAEEWADNNSIPFVNATVYTAEDIENDAHLFGIGATKPEYVVAQFNDDFTEVTIFANGEDSDGKMRNFSSGNTLNQVSRMNGSSLVKADIKSGVHSVSEYAFYTCDTLTDVNITGVTSIDNGAFGYCTALKNIDIPNSVISIGDSAFTNTSISNINIPNSVKTIGYGAFWSCPLVSITIPNSVSSISDSTFYDCTSLETVSISDGVISIESKAFENCTSLTRIELPNSITAIGDNAFSSTGLTEIVIPNGVTVISDRTFYDCGALKKVVIPNGVTKIGNSAFYLCKSLTDINIPDSVSSIGNEAFSGCSSLTNVTIPDGVATIGSKTFSACSALSEITIGSGTSNIANNAFYKCSNIQTVYGHSSTYAETWANDNGYTFVAID